MKSIELLPEHIIDQIKAGEVIERASTLLKEILENSIDSGATELELELHNNGIDLISLKDNGSGIAHDDIELAFCRHATSKIKNFEDIYNLYTYGFRGEALASIASISKVTCITNQKDSPESKVKIEGAKLISSIKSEKIKKESGTTLYIKDLFFNTPVRIKFIQSQTSEKNQIKKILNAFLLTHPQVQFSIKWDNDEKRIYPICSLEQRIGHVYSQTKKVTLAHMSNSYDGVNFSLYLAKESSRGNAFKQHFIFVNNRIVQDHRVHKIIINSAKRIWPEGETGNYYAYLEIPPERIDVNVHPNKTVIKFFEPAKIHALISQTIKVQLIKSNDKQTSSHAQEQEMSLPINNDREYSQINYRNFDFNKEDSKEEYFGKLHGTNEVQIESPTSIDDFQHLASQGNFRLYKKSGKIYLINVKKSFLQYIKDMFTSSHFNTESTPLLVSRPIKLEKKIPEQLLELINKKGFDLEPIAPNEYILRGFPNCLNGYPYTELLESLLKSEIKDIASNKILSLELDFEFEKFNPKKIINFYTLVKLLKYNIATELSLSDLEKTNE